MLIGDRTVPDGVVVAAPGGADPGAEAQAVTVVLEDLRQLAAAVEQTLEETGTGTTRATEDISLGRPSDAVAQDLVALAQTAHDVYRESVTYVLSSLESYRDALLASSAGYARAEEGVEDDLAGFNRRVDAASTASTPSEQQAALPPPEHDGSTRPTDQQESS